MSKRPRLSEPKKGLQQVCPGFSSLVEGHGLCDSLPFGGLCFRSTNPAILPGGDLKRRTKGQLQSPFQPIFPVAFAAQPRPGLGIGEFIATAQIPETSFHPRSPHIPQLQTHHKAFGAEIFSFLLSFVK